MNHIALFAGIGGFMFATRELKIKTLLANDLDASCCKFLRDNFPKAHILEKGIECVEKSDLEQISEEVDLLTAGFPCQSFSSAGGRSIKAFDDPRGKLFFEIPKFIKNLKFPPKVVLLENVPNLKIYDNGALLKTVITKMRLAGYWVSDKNVAILSAAEYGGSPQNRKRLFVVCKHKSYFKSNSFDFTAIKKKSPEDLFSIVGAEKDVDKSHYLSRESKYRKMIDKLADKHGKKRLFQIRRVEARACPPNTCPTLTANMGSGGHNIPFTYDRSGLRKLSINECLRLQGFDPNEIDMTSQIPINDIRKMIGNAVHVNVVKNIILEIQNQLNPINRP
jgi:DNA (cytosine-5)-methyltransferase 1